jgi:hypothetical protein
LLTWQGVGPIPEAELHRASVDHINTQDLAALERFLEAPSSPKAKVHETRQVTGM